MILYTPPKTNMEPENGPLEKEIPPIISRFHVEFRGCKFKIRISLRMTDPNKKNKVKIQLLGNSFNLEKYAQVVNLDHFYHFPKVRGKNSKKICELPPPRWLPGNSASSLNSFAWMKNTMENPFLRSQKIAPPVVKMQSSWNFPSQEIWPQTLDFSDVSAAFGVAFLPKKMELRWVFLLVSEIHCFSVKSMVFLL